MSENMNDPSPTSFQPGEPVGRAPIADSEPGEDSDDAIPKPTGFDRLVAAIKARELWGLAGGVGLQFLVLLSMIVLGVGKVLNDGF